MISYREMLEQWGENGLLYLPLERFADHLGFPPDRTRRDDRARGGAG